MKFPILKMKMIAEYLECGDKIFFYNDNIFVTLYFL